MKMKNLFTVLALCILSQPLLVNAQVDFHEWKTWKTSTDVISPATCAYLTDKCYPEYDEASSIETCTLRKAYLDSEFRKYLILTNLATLATASKAEVAFARIGTTTVLSHNNRRSDTKLISETNFCILDLALPYSLKFDKKETVFTGITSQQDCAKFLEITNIDGLATHIENPAILVSAECSGNEKISVATVIRVIKN
jgi:hypothetical protein